MKILGICCSPRKGQNTELMLRTALEAAEDQNAQTEFYSVIGKNIHPCDGCRSCISKGICHINDDMQELYEKMKAAYGILFASPVYFFNVTSQAKAIMDRTYALQPIGQPLRNKVGGAMACAGSTGLFDAVKSMQTFFTVHGMFFVNWVGIYSPAEDKPKGLEAARKLGQDMISFAEKSFTLPEDLTPNHSTFGTHTY